MYIIITAFCKKNHLAKMQAAKLAKKNNIEAVLM